MLSNCFGLLFNIFIHILDRLWCSFNSFSIVFHARITYKFILCYVKQFLMRNFFSLGIYSFLWFSELNSIAFFDFFVLFSFLLEYCTLNVFIFIEVDHLIISISVDEKKLHDNVLYERDDVRTCTKWCRPDNSTQNNQRSEKE